MLDNYNRFQEQLLDQELEHHQRQSIEAALVMLVELMTNKTRDIRRRSKS